MQQDLIEKIGVVDMNDVDKTGAVDS